ncbi:MAG: D-glycerate dehydrogenase [Alphaproteobacteria bacterium]
MIQITQPAPRAVMQALESLGPVTIAPVDGVADGTRALIVTVEDRLDAGAISALPTTVGLIASYAVGVDHIDIKAAAARGIKVSNTPDVVAIATAETAMLCLLGAARRARDAQAMLYSGQWSGFSISDMLGHELAGRRLGIVGLGAIGREMAIRAAAFGMEIHYHNRHKRDSAPKGWTYHDSLESMMRAVDTVSLHCPLTADTTHLINRKRLSWLKRGAILVNTARGPVVKDDALIEALQSGHLAAAGLDVFTGEPEIDERYYALNNVFLLPHIGTQTLETRTAMGLLVARNIDAFLNGGDLPSQVG